MKRIWGLLLLAALLFIGCTPLAITNDTEVRVRAFAANQVPSPVVGAVYRLTFLGINEFLASNAMTSPEIHDFGDFSDFIEINNAGSNTVNLGGYHLSDSVDQPFKWQIPAGASVPPGGYFLVWADGFDSPPASRRSAPTGTTGTSPPATTTPASSSARTARRCPCSAPTAAGWTR